MAVNNKKKKNNLKRKIIFAVIGALLISVSVFFSSQFFSEVNTSITLRAQLNDVQHELNELNQQKENLQNEKEKLSDENYLKSVARGKYLITIYNEQIYVLPSLDE